jgi:hypothetical protein
MPRKRAPYWEAVPATGGIRLVVPTSANGSAIFGSCRSWEDCAVSVVSAVLKGLVRANVLVKLMERAEKFGLKSKIGFA